MNNRSVTERLAAVAVMTACFLCLLGLNSCSKKSSGSNGSFEPGSEFFVELRANIQSSVTDPERVTKMLAIADQIELDMRELDGEVRAFNKNYQTNDSNYQATREEFETMFSDFEKTVAEYRGRFLDSILEMRTHTTREEWAALSDRDHTLYNSWRRRYEI